MAAALLDWQPVYVLEQENCKLREENRMLQSQVKELIRWKDKAIMQLARLGAKRQQTEQGSQHVATLQRKLREAEKALQQRTTLEQTVQQLRETQESRANRVRALQAEKAAMARDSDQLRQAETTAKEHLQLMADAFRVHLERFVALRERLEQDPTIDARDEQGTSELRFQVTDMDMTTPSTSKGESASQSPSPSPSPCIEDPLALIGGLSGISTMCLRWLEHHVVARLPQLEVAAEQASLQQPELEQLRTRVVQQQQELDRAQQTLQQQSQHALQQVAALEQTKTQLEDELRRSATEHSTYAHDQQRTTDHMRLLVAEVRRYLRIVRTEIKKKFGYVPDAIARVDDWTRLLDVLDCHCTAPYLS